MKNLSLGVLLLACTGCFHLYRKPVIAPEEVAAQIQFPEWSQDATTTLTGPQLKALQIALDDFRPIGTAPSTSGDAYTNCLRKLRDLRCLDSPWRGHDLHPLHPQGG